ncbi:hypothetical protein HF1_13330 [Mycoplasma haemofelis str. Langford 1]|uniref:Uncharacterized protein n=1 Tax=Mycoplasma haemofelis (strain Langford 1) TaxID=941640 RepID=E8ZJM0_MYCHL|nr:hypothetical protein [Mycoplasma haemofelis]CBY93341.1 hypothetical protein HF1_13330 [Mycoplasma haemofelis str. Langford 1]
MTSPTAIKAASGLGALGAMGGGVALYKSGAFASKTTLGQLVQKDSWTLLTAKDTTHISTILEAYKKEPKPTLPFSGFTGKEADASKRLLEECNKASDKPFDDSNKVTLLKQIKKWCVIPKTLQERLKDLGITPLSTAEPNPSSTEVQDWTNKVGTYDNGNNKFDQLASLTDGDNNAKAKTLRTTCQSKLTTKSFEESFDTILGQVKTWCV